MKVVFSVCVRVCVCVILVVLGDSVLRVDGFTLRLSLFVTDL